jgi:hypothetical protein
MQANVQGPQLTQVPGCLRWKVDVIGTALRIKNLGRADLEIGDTGNRGQTRVSAVTVKPCQIVVCPLFSPYFRAGSCYAASQAGTADRSAGA